jgi:hypothetical protein
MLRFGHNVACSFAYQVRAFRGLSTSSALLVGVAATFLVASSFVSCAHAASSSPAVPSEQAPSSGSDLHKQPLADILAPAEAEVSGFRSAKFGMNEAEVRVAIKKDFAQQEHEAKESLDPVEQTKVLALDVPALLPDGGAAKVAYVFGYKSKKLIQVSVLWSKATDKRNTPEHLLAAGEILRANFLGEGFKKDLIAVDKSIPAGVLLFRGADAAGHVTLLLLRGTNDKQKKGEAFEPTSLLLLYVADAKHPDIFKIPHGEF